MLNESLKTDYNYGSWIDVIKFSNDNKMDLKHCDNMFAGSIMRGFINEKVQVLDENDEFPDFVNIINLLANFMRYGPGKRNFFYYKIYFKLENILLIRKVIKTKS